MSGITLHCIILYTIEYTGDWYQTTAAKTAIQNVKIQYLWIVWVVFIFTCQSQTFVVISWFFSSCRNKREEILFTIYKS